jgi:drug/metabolite transporter (DMT)-like permease
MHGFHPPPNTPSWLLLLTIVVFGSVIPMAAFAYSMPKLGPSTYGIIASSELLTVVAIGVAFLGERLTALQIGGAILVISGIVLSGLNFKSTLLRRTRPAA